MLIHKDVGQIPYHLARELGWDCTLVSWSRTEFKVIQPADYAEWVDHVSLGVFSSRAARNLAALNYLRQHAREIDVLLIYHLTSDALAQVLLFKALNPSGVAVLKLDVDHRTLEAFDDRATIKQRLLVRILSLAPFDLVTAETRQMAGRLGPLLAKRGVRLSYFPVGIELEPQLDIELLLQRKENVVLTAGRLGLTQKNNELLLEAIAQLSTSESAGWTFWFVGSRTPEFDAALKRLVSQRPDLGPKLVVKDFIESREELRALYERARVYCLTSRWESFAIVLAEAARHGCYLVSTDVGAADDLTDGGRTGSLIRSEEQLTSELRAIMNGTRETADGARRTHNRVSEQLAWPKVVRDFAALVTSVGKLEARVERT